MGWALAVWRRRVGFTSRASIRCGFTALCRPKACRSKMASAIPSSRPQALLTLPIVRAFAACATTTPSADFCHVVRTPYGALSHGSVTPSRSPVISSTAFYARPPDLPPVPLMDMGFAITCSLARHRRPHHPVLVHRPAYLLHASFGPHLAVTPLRFAITSPPSGCEEDFHLQAVEHARRTSQKRRTRVSAPHMQSRIPSLLYEIIAV